MIYGAYIGYNFRDLKLAVFIITGLFSNHKRRHLRYEDFYTNTFKTSLCWYSMVPQDIRTPCLKQGFGVSILHDLCCFNLFRLLETWSKHEQEDHSRSFICLKLFICHKSTSCYFKFSRLLETRSKHEQEDQSSLFFCFRLDCKMFEAAHLSLKSTCFMLIQPFKTFRGTG